MTSALAGHQWNEGDVSCSGDRAPRTRWASGSRSSSRSFGFSETWLTVLRQMEVFPRPRIAAENERNLPFLATDDDS